MSDKELTPIQKFLRREARALRHLWCNICHLAPPHPALSGRCEECEKELGGEA